MRKKLSLMFVLLIFTFGLAGVASAADAAELPITLNLEYKATATATDFNVQTAQTMFRAMEALNRIYANYGVTNSEELEAVHKYMEGKDKAFFANPYGGVWSLYRNEDGTIWFCGPTNLKTQEGWYYVFYIEIE